MNYGVSFGWFPMISSWVVGGVLLYLIYLALKTRELLGKIGIGVMIFGGSINLWQRIVYGGVRDPWKFFGLGYNNFADYLIFFGLVVYGYSYFVRGRSDRGD